MPTYTSRWSLDRFTHICIKNEALRPLAERLSAYLAPLTSARLPVSESADSPAFILAVDNAVGNGYMLKANGEHFIIVGGNLAQTVRGVYRFLTDLCGIRMFTADRLVYPGNPPTISPDTAYSFTPPFEYTEIDWFSPKHTEYALFNHINGTKYRSLPAAMGGGVTFLSGFAHTLTKEFCAADTYFAEHPEYFALRGGKRTKKQLCLSNPDVQKLVTDEVLALLKKKHNPAAALQIVSLSQADNLGFCRCPACRELDKKHHSHAGSLLTFVNAVAQAVKDAGYNNVAIDTFAYQYTRKPPVDLLPSDNVIVRLCAIECCFSHPLTDKHCPSNAAFAADLKKWATLCKRLYVWDYGTNYNHFAGLFPNLHVLSPNFRFYADNGVKGVYCEGNPTLKTPDTEFGELRAYLQTRLFADPYRDLTKDRNAFLRATYGGGGQAVGEFLDYVGARVATRHIGVFQPMKKTLTLSPNEVRLCDVLWDTAEKNAGNRLPSVERSRLCFEYWKMKNRRGVYGNPLSYRRRRAALLAKIQAAGITRLQESNPTRSFWNGVFQWLYFAAHPLVRRVMRWLYRV